MTTNHEIQAAAERMIKLYGLHADLEAAMRADQCVNQGDTRGTHTWRRVVTAIHDLRRAGAGKGKPAK